MDNKFLLSTDTLSGYGLDLIFDTAAGLGFDGVDLAMWKNFDTWNIEYVAKLVKNYNISVGSIQISNNPNLKELNQAVELAKTVGCNYINLNAPSIFNFTSFRFIENNLQAFRNQNPKIKFGIINPEKSNLLALPIPKFRFSNMIDIIKKYHCYLGLDISNMDIDTLEVDFVRKLPNFIPYMSTVYLSDKSTIGKGHLPLGDGNIKIPVLLKKLKSYEYAGNFSIKLDLDKKILADIDKIKLLLKKARMYYKEYYEEIKIE